MKLAEDYWHEETDDREEFNRLFPRKNALKLMGRSTIGEETYENQDSELEIEPG
jgi:hypothetical protein|tara:strand:+ start:113 stop:274 length:162 start_codon:yes stop_codon:yes gene_type:complete